MSIAPGAPLTSGVICAGKGGAMFYGVNSRQRMGSSRQGGGGGAFDGPIL